MISVGTANEPQRYGLVVRSDNTTVVGADRTFRDHGIRFLTAQGRLDTSLPNGGYAWVRPWRCPGAGISRAVTIAGAPANATIVVGYCESGAQAWVARVAQGASRPTSSFGSPFSSLDTAGVDAIAVRNGKIISVGRGKNTSSSWLALARWDYN